MNLERLADPLTIVTLLLLVALFPWMGRWEYARLKRWIREGRADARLSHFQWIQGWEWITTIVLLAGWFAGGRTLAELGLVPTASGWQWLGVALGLVAGLLVVIQMMVLLRRPESLRQLRGEIGDLIHMVPTRPEEERSWFRLSVTAGVCEEIIYRGLLLGLLAAAVGTWPAVVLSSVIFGLGHLYQGPVGFTKTSLIGLAMALITVFSGSIFVPILVHVIMDVTSGKLMVAAMREGGKEPEGKLEPLPA